MARLPEQPVKSIFAAALQWILAVFITYAALSEAAAGAQGVLEVRVKDHREAIGDFSKLSLTIDKIAIRPKPGLKFWQDGWKDLTPATNSVDLTQYTGNKSAAVFRAGVQPGSFDAVHLKVKSVDATLKKGQHRAQIKNSVGPVNLPFEVRAQGETLIVLDLVVLDMSDHPPRGYELGIKGYELYTNGKLIDKIPPGP